MNKETSELLTQLAQQLSTTTEKLWLVLVCHAHLAAINAVVENILFVVFWYALYKAHIKLSDTKDGYSGYYKHELAAHIPMVCGFLIGLFFVIIFFMNITEAVNGFCDPEYWAFNKILDSLKK